MFLSQRGVTLQYFLALNDEEIKHQSRNANAREEGESCISHGRGGALWAKLSFPRGRWVGVSCVLACLHRHYRGGLTDGSHRKGIAPSFI